MGFESDVKEYHRRAGRRPDEDDAPKPRPDQRQGHFQPRQMRVKNEEPEVDFKTRMKNLTKVNMSLNCFRGNHFESFGRNHFECPRGKSNGNLDRS